MAGIPLACLVPLRRLKIQDRPQTRARSSSQAHRESVENSPEANRREEGPATKMAPGEMSIARHQYVVVFQ
jgi:hypothetical protein